jgi:arylsulfatase A
MRRRDFLRMTALGAVAAPLPWIGGDALRWFQKTGARQPNFVFILIDDLGWADVGAYGSRFHETPNIDRLAAQSMRFTDAYAACPVCSPTRASILTGKYPARLHLTDWIPGEGNRPTQPLLIPDWQQSLPRSEITIARALKPLGYTTASIGKWHLGGPGDLPPQYGFDLNIAGSRFGQPATYFWPYEGSSYTVPDLEAGGSAGEYLTDRLTDEAERFIASHRDQPFFLYFPHFAVHAPLMAKPEVLDKYTAKTPSGEQKNPTYAAMVESVDDSVGRILRRLDTEGIADRTVVVFMSDNGGLWPQATSNAPLRAGKGFPYEGGIREPLIVRWPGVTQAGAASAVPVSSVDFFPTLLEIAGARLPGAVDGVSLVPLLRRTGGLSRDALFWHYPHYWGGNPPRVRPFGAGRAGDWKLIAFYEDLRVELYNLKDDLGESRDLARDSPDRADALRRRLHEWRAAVGAQMPVPR